MASYRYRASSEAETVRLAEQLAEGAFPGAIVALDGDLGAGKTRFSQAFAARLGVSEPVTSPTFTLIREYESGRLPFYHLDVYRLTEDEADDLGLDEYFYSNGVTVVEWAERIHSLLPEQRLHLELLVTGPTEREIVLRPIGARCAQWCNNLNQNGE